jgi:RNA polymerase subunit RPABC4/transcription elongation factor Spt4
MMSTYNDSGGDTMVCLKCGYAMSASDKECPRCAAMREQQRQQQLPVVRKPQQIDRSHRQQSPTEPPVYIEYPVQQQQPQIYATPERICPKCGLVVTKETRFCPQCGYDLTGQTKRDDNSGTAWCIAGGICGGLSVLLMPCILGPLGIVFGAIGAAKGKVWFGLGVVLGTIIFMTLGFVVGMAAYESIFNQGFREGLRTR